MPLHTYIFEDEDNFQVRSTNDRTIAEFSIEQFNSTHYRAYLRKNPLESFVSEKIPVYYGQDEKILIYHGQDKCRAIIAAHGAARYFARQLDTNFEDLSNLAEMYGDSDGSAVIPYYETGKQEEEVKDNLNS